MSAPSPSTAPAVWRARAEPIALGAMTLGAALMIQPWWGGGLRLGFFVVLAATLAQNALAHAPRGKGAAR